MTRFYQVEKHFKWLNVLFLIVTLILVIFLARGVWRVYNQSRFANSNYLLTKDRLTKLEYRQKQITDRLEKLSTDRGLEEEFRNNFSVVRPGEKMTLIVDSIETATDTATTSEASLWGTLKALLLSR